MEYPNNPHRILWLDLLDDQVTLDAMAKLPETKLKERVLFDLRSLPKTWAVKVQQVAIRGTPDILCCIKGRFVALELKSSAGAHIDELQMYTIKQISAAKGSAFIVFPENWEATLTYIKENFLRGMPMKNNTHQ